MKKIMNWSRFEGLVNVKQISEHLFSDTAQSPIKKKKVAVNDATMNNGENDYEIK
jgi:hypothetical protein